MSHYQRDILGFGDEETNGDHTGINDEIYQAIQWGLEPTILWGFLVEHNGISTHTMICGVYENGAYRHTMAYPPKLQNLIREAKTN